MLDNIEQPPTIPIDNISNLTPDELNTLFQTLQTRADNVRKEALETGKSEELDKLNLELQRVKEELENLYGRAESITLAEAREILKDRVFGPEEVKKVFNIDMVDIPDIPFTLEQLEKAKEKGLDLILYTNEDLPNGVKMNGLGIITHLNNQKKDNTKLLSNIDWYKSEPFYISEQPKLCWKLVSREVIPDSTSKNYLEQTQILAKYIESLYTNKDDIPEDIQQALEELTTLLQDQSFINEVSSTDESIWKPIAERLSNLKLTQLFRESFIEWLYRTALTNHLTGEKLLENMYSWTKSLSSGRGLVASGAFDADGAYVLGLRPDY